MNKSKQDSISRLISESEIVHVVNSYFRALDEKHFDVNHFAAIVTEHAKMTRPNGLATVGIEAICASHTKSMSHFESTQHILTGHDVSIDGDTASVRANLVAMHVYNGSNQDANNFDNFFVAGGVIRVELLFADEHWKISLLSNDVVWRAGNSEKLLTLFKSMANDLELNNRQTNKTT